MKNTFKTALLMILVLFFICLLYAGQAGLPIEIKIIPTVDKLRVSFRIVDAGITADAGPAGAINYTLTNVAIGSGVFNYVNGYHTISNFSFPRGLVDGGLSGLSGNLTFKLKDNDDVSWGPLTAPVFYTKTYFVYDSLASLGLEDLNHSCSSFGDYDNDGDLDLAIAGENSGGAPRSRIYRNNGNSTFTNISTSILDVENSSLDFGDYDNDGDLDLLLSGTTNTGDEVTKIYRNDFNTDFVDIFASLPYVTNGVVKFSDFDDDGDLDVVVAGNTGSSRITKIYINNGANTFSDSGINLTGFDDCDLDLGDYDNDGDIDLLISGDTDSGTQTIIYKNNGDTTFSDSGISLLGLKSSAASFADYDNDGDLDLAIAGTDGTVNPDRRKTKLYKNNGNSSFIDTGFSFRGVDKADVGFGDYDSDGDLDLFIAGNCEPIPGVYTLNSVIEVYLNKGDSTFDTDKFFHLYGIENGSLAFGDYDNDSDLDVLTIGYEREAGGTSYTRFYESNVDDRGITNSKPTAPSTNFDVSYDSDKQLLKLSWDESTDTETPKDGLYYEIRVATLPITVGLKSWIVSPGSKKIRPVKQIAQTASYKKQATEKLELHLTNIPERQTYYWSVRAVDTSFQKSNWSAQQSVFTLGSIDIPVLITPENNFYTNNKREISFDWTDSMSINGIKDYEMQISTSPDFYSLEHSEILVNTEKTLTFSTDREYYWRVRAHDNLGFYSLWSDVWKFSIFFPENNLSDALVFPNPYKVGSSGMFDRIGGVIFENLTPRALIRIYTIMGELVYEGNEEDADGRYEWDIKNLAGREVATGVYIYLITNPENKNDKAEGKIGIMNNRW